MEKSKKEADAGYGEMEERVEAGFGYINYECVLILKMKKSNCTSGD